MVSRPLHLPSMIRKLPLESWCPHCHHSPLPQRRPATITGTAWSSQATLAWDEPLWLETLEGPWRGRYVACILIKNRVMMWCLKTERLRWCWAAVVYPLRWRPLTHIRVKGLLSWAQLKPMLLYSSVNSSSSKRQDKHHLLEQKALLQISNHSIT